MSDYGSPGPQGPYGQPPQGSSGAPSSFPSPGSAPKSADSAQIVAYSNYAGVVFGVLAFIWGFLGWIKADTVSASGYATIGTAAVGLSLAAGLMTGVAVVEKSEKSTLAPTAVAAAALLVTVGQLISHGEGRSAGIGLILTLVTTILQVGALGYGWMIGSGRMAAPSQSPKPQQSPWQGGQQGLGQPGTGQQGGYGGYQQGGGYGQYQPSAAPPAAPSYGSPGQYGPSGGGQQPGAAPSSPPQGANPYGPPSGYGAPGQSGSSQAEPSQSGTTSSMPAQGATPYQPPSPSGNEESGSGYGEATRHIPRYTGPGSEQSGQDQSGS